VGKKGQRISSLPFFTVWTPAESFEFLLKSAKSSYRRKTVSNFFSIFWIPGQARNDKKGRFSKVSGFRRATDKLILQLAHQ
jgi:hypothetical protein